VTLESVGRWKGMWRGHGTHWVILTERMCVAGRRMVISDHIGSLGIRIDADLWSLVKVERMGGMYVRIYIASVGVS